MMKLIGKEKILYSINKTVSDFEDFYKESKKNNSWDEKELYLKLGTVILWFGVWINKIYEIEKEEKCNVFLRPDDVELKNAFLGAYNAQKHSITIYDISITYTARFPSGKLYPSAGVYPSKFSCKWRKLNKGDINNIEPYNKVLNGKEILPTINEMKHLIKDISKKL